MNARFDDLLRLQREYNYLMSQYVELVGLTPKQPILIDTGRLHLWQRWLLAFHRHCASLGLFFTLPLSIRWSIGF